MIERIEFENFKALRKTSLDLGPFTLIVGPNGSGKSTVFQALQGLAAQQTVAHDSVQHVEAGSAEVRVRVWARTEAGTSGWGRSWKPGAREPKSGVPERFSEVRSVRIYSLDAEAIAKPSRLDPGVELAPNGGNLPTVLDRLRDEVPERFDALNAQLAEWLPEFDRILFETPSSGQRAIKLRVRGTEKSIQASELSQGILLSLALLTLAYQPEPPALIGLEEPDRGIHPRLFRRVQEALYRLAYPQNYGEDRPPTQVIATTHSPVMLDLFRDYPEQIVIANKEGTELTFTRLSEMEQIDEILEGASLGEVWYTGILGGVPIGS